MFEEIGTLGLAIAGLVIGLRVLAWFLTAQQLQKLRLCPWPHRAVDDAEIPEDTRRFLEQRSVELEGLGFVRQGYVLGRNIGDPPETAERPGLLFEHAGTGAGALITPADGPDALEPHAVGFLACFSDGSRLAGVNGLEWCTLGPLAGTELLDPYALTIADQWQHFRARLVEAVKERTIQRLSPPEYAKAREQEAVALLEQLDRQGLTVKGPDPQVRTLSLLASARIGLRMVLRGRRAHELRRKRALMLGGARHPIRLPVELEIAAHQRVEAMRRQPNRRQRWGLLFGLTAVAFGLSMLHLFDPEAVLSLLAVVFFHELGHWAAMRAFGYRDTTIFFIPFFGGAATGRKDHVALHEELLVLLAGPVPGLVLALILSFVPAQEAAWIQDLVVMLVVINAANLLPLFPLDGGRIVHALLFTGRPLLGTSFRAVAGLIFLGSGFWLNDRLLMFFGAITLLTLRHAAWSARAEQALKVARAEPGQGEKNVLEVIFERSSLLGLDQAAPPVRHALVRQLLERSRRGVASLGAVAAWLTLYSSLLAGGVYGSYRLLSPSAELRWPDEELELSCTADRQAQVRALLDTLPPGGQVTTFAACKAGPVVLERSYEEVPTLIEDLCLRGCKELRLELNMEAFGEPR